MLLTPFRFLSKILGNEAAINNAKQDKQIAEFQMARADIVAAKIRGGSNVYHRFLVIAQNSLESGEVRPGQVRHVMKLAEEGTYHPHQLQRALFEPKNPQGQPA